MCFSRLQDEKISHKEASTKEALQGNDAAIIPKVDNSLGSNGKQKEKKIVV
jgi:hypothetical protein